MDSLDPEQERDILDPSMTPTRASTLREQANKADGENGANGSASGSLSESPRES